jgi:hypothetical protein
MRQSFLCLEEVLPATVNSTDFVTVRVTPLSS